MQSYRDRTGFIWTSCALNAMIGISHSTVFIATKTTNCLRVDSRNFSENDKQFAPRVTSPSEGTCVELSRDLTPSRMRIVTAAAGSHFAHTLAIDAHFLYL
ncbi:hypothetical protein EVAR_51180_1 [Eumeta japonica]|uniref:Uncharacterized protein n=1 Tax=Eumeta variegata TaxID=151549 RepID=A0A4C1XCA1_EUMVA|nr:hypothetical protein EVAR_51180_1 [Eumeta japonica]